MPAKKNNKNNLKKKKDSPSQLLIILLRYLFLLILSIFLLSEAFNQIILVLTIYPVNFMLSLFFESFVDGALILVEKVSIKLIPACLAISAYLLLISLNFLVAMKPLKRISSLIFSILLLLSLNIARIFVLSLWIIKDIAYYNIVHKLIWYLLSTLLVIGIWFLTAYLFKIKEYPVYSDFNRIKTYFTKN